MGIADRITNWIAGPEPYSGPTTAMAGHYAPPALSAAATSGPSRSDVSSAPAAPDWQDRAWSYYRTCGEARRAVDWIAHGISRCHLFIGKVTDDGAGDPEPVENPGTAEDVLDELCDAMGESALLKRLAQHLLIPGESWLIGYPAPKGALTEADTCWTVASRHEWALDQGAGTLRVCLPDHPGQDTDGWVVFPAQQVTTVRIWDPDPADGSRSTSPFEAALAALDELDGLDARVQADIQSRLAGAGLVEIPESATMPNPGQSDSVGVNPINGSPLVEGVMNAAKTAIQKPHSPEAVVPIFYTTSDEAAGKTRHITFQTEFDAQIPTLRGDARKRLSTVMDIPGEVITGMEDLSHWTAWAVSEDAIKSHLGPLLSLICDQLTRKVLWPALKAGGESLQTLRGLAIWWDASEITLRPDRSTETLTAQKQGIISNAAARRELAFSDDDAPDGEGEEPAGPAASSEPQQDGQQDQQQGEQDQSSPQANEQQPQSGGGQAHPGNRPEPPQREQSNSR